MGKRRKKQEVSLPPLGCKDVLASDYDSWLVKYKSKIDGNTVKFIALEKKQPKTNQAFWGLVKMTGAERMNLLRKPPEAIP